MNSDKLLIEIFGEENLEYFRKQNILIDQKKARIQVLHDLRHRASDAFKVNLSFPDIIIASSSGVLLGLANALFKDFVPKHGGLSHKHRTTRTAIDYKIPKPKGFKGSVQNLHRQIGPSHDIFRFKEAISLIGGESTDFSLWGTTATEILGHDLRPGNLPLDQFRNLGGFRIPTNPKAELLNHLLIDFFTRRSLPIPGTTILADNKPELATTMLNMYDKGLNLKTALGNFFGYTLIQIIIHGYTFLFKAIPASQFKLKPFEIENFKNLFSTYLKLIRKNEFHMMMMISHGASFLTDTIITTGTKSYAGIFQLNYLSLMAFSQHLLQYMLNSVKEYNQLIKQSKEKALEIGKIDDMWFSNFRDAIYRNVYDPKFLSILDSDSWILQKQRLIDATNTINRNISKQIRLSEELKDLMSDDS
ncbi:MAG: hypothetical protein QQN41_05790 [Nitrosopumilus sp.]